ncbi:hypothetical protein E2C01_055204 [Portunus trituberculatus]|uniref:Uncharacterized protein n=1 Tax=Portunus trituberculatus TaxID=210409 RepID=A0A5B7GLV4_PORTR|nr:hypothetical protein [Portunus trituberculatus]
MPSPPRTLPASLSRVIFHGLFFNCFPGSGQLIQRGWPDSPVPPGVALSRGCGWGRGLAVLISGRAGPLLRVDLGASAAAREAACCATRGAGGGWVEAGGHPGTLKPSVPEWSASWLAADGGRVSGLSMCVRREESVGSPH